jgi:AraC family transcriptional regulator of adaptative response/methylated-DNA-[protein]-cysteine methyltransferase
MRTTAMTAAIDHARRPDYADDHQRWTAVLERDVRADGVFVYAVTTTGIYCRPSCPARRPRPANVRFHRSCREAEGAGFRPCRRCRPDLHPAPGVAAVADACRLIETSEEPPALAALAAAVGLSRSYFQRQFKAVTGLTPGAYAAAHRASRLRRQLPESATVTEAMFEAGFNSSGRFYAAADDMLGMTPTAYRRGGDGVAIRFAVGECSLGSILVAMTEKGVCAIELGDEPDSLVRTFQDRFPAARLIGGDPEFETLVARVVGLVEAPQRGLDLPLDVRGTAFQLRVWKALTRIPAGRTVSYTELARQIGVPGAARAVARACASNRIAVAIPCHRVVRSDGALSGYRWGVERKRRLLEREAS